MNYFPCFNSYIGYGCGGCIVYTDQLGWFPNNYNHINFPSQEVGFVIAEDSMQSQPVAKLDSSEIVLEDTMKVNQKVSWREKWKQFFSRKKSKAE
jgi:hypothetical protein